MPTSSQDIPSTNDKTPWLYSWVGDRRKAKIRVQQFELMMRVEKDEIVFSECTQNSIVERRVPLSIGSIDEEAKHYEILTGKWLVFRPREQIDDVWMIIKEKTRNGELGIAAKVSTLFQGKDRHVICVYTENYFDKEDVFRVRESLRNLGIEETLYYKPDIYTHLNIYSGTTNLRPWRYKD